MTCRVKIQNKLLEKSVTSVGLRQEDTLSCILFKLALEKVIKDSEIETKGTIFIKRIQICVYADDIVAVWRSTDSMKEAINKLMKAEKVMKFTNKMQKKKYMEVIQKPTNTNMLKTDNQNMRVKNLSI